MILARFPAKSEINTVKFFCSVTSFTSKKSRIRNRHLNQSSYPARHFKNNSPSDELVNIYLSKEILAYFRKEFKSFSACLQSGLRMLDELLAAYATIDWTCWKRLCLRADGEDDGNSRFYLTVGYSILSFPSEPVNGNHLRCGWVKRLGLWIQEQ